MRTQLHAAGFDITIHPSERPSSPRVPDISQGELITRILNVSPLNLEACLDEAKRSQLGDSPIPAPELNCLFQSYLSHRLGTYVDPWLETGRRSDGSERPGDRRVVPGVLFDVHKCAAQHRFRTTLPIRGLRLPAAFQGIEENAMRLFILIVGSDWQNQLCKCRYLPCGRYFLVVRPRPQYRQGTFCCVRHQRNASAQAVTRMRRRDTRIRLIDCAAAHLAALGKGPEWQDDTAVKREIAGALCAKINADSELRGLKAWRNGVRANWVALYGDRIEQRRRDLEPHRAEV